MIYIIQTAPSVIEGRIKYLKKARSPADDQGKNTSPLISVIEYSIADKCVY
jgi:hypothetical protein